MLKNNLRLFLLDDGINYHLIHINVCYFAETSVVTLKFIQHLNNAIENFRDI
jgi:hypothetical protein